MADNYWEDTGDDGNSSTGGDFYADWQANRKAYAMWYILARIAGWDGSY